MGDAIKTVKTCHGVQEYVWLEGALMRKREFQELLAKNPKKALEHLSQTKAYQRSEQRFIRLLVNMASKKAGLAGGVEASRS